jgi:FixJ family two-component response regulator
MTEEEAIIFVIEDDPAVRIATARLLQSADLTVETFDSAEAFLRRPRWEAPACLILDVWLPGLSGLELQRALTAAAIQLPIIFITGHGDIPMSVQAMKAGAVEFLSKPFHDQVLLDAIAEAIARDRAARHQHAALAVLRERYARLTPREREVMARVVAGLPNKRIAAELGICEQTVKVHRYRATHKMQAESLADLVRIAKKLDIPHTPSSPI